MKKWAEEAEINQESKFGVKGFSLLSNYLTFPQCIPVDYMHCVLEGVVKQLLKLWFGSNFHKEAFSLRKNNQFDKILSNIKTPNEIQRRPRSLDHISMYKASECMAWILFYALPVLSLFLPLQFFRHLSLLVCALHILLSDSVVVKELDLAYNMLSTFYQRAGDLYKQSIYTINMHSLEHIVAFVKLWGPLWSYSMFGFENLNGYIGKMYHGTSKIVYQMSFQIQLSQTRPDKLQELSCLESTETKVYIKKILSKNKTKMHEFAPHCYALGKLAMYTLNDEEKLIATSHGFTDTENVMIFHRLMLHHTIYSSEQYRRKGMKRNNSICCFCSSSGEYGYGQIMGFYMPNNSVPFSIIRPFQLSDDSPLNNIQPIGNETYI